MMKMKILLILLSTCLTNSHILLTNLKAPSSISEGDNLDLACEYSVSRLILPELDIKMYIGDSPSPFLVFLPYYHSKPMLVEKRYNEVVKMIGGERSTMVTFANITLDLRKGFREKIEHCFKEGGSRIKGLIFHFGFQIWLKQ